MHSDTLSYLVDTYVMIYVKVAVQLDHTVVLQGDLFSVDSRFTTQMPACLQYQDFVASLIASRLVNWESQMSIGWLAQYLHKS